VLLVLMTSQVAEAAEGLEGGACVADVLVEDTGGIVGVDVAVDFEEVVSLTEPWAQEGRLRLFCSISSTNIAAAQVGQHGFANLVSNVKNKKKPYLPSVAPLAYSCWPLESIGSRLHSSPKFSIG